MPKFDVIVGNPPYQRGTHLDFLKLAYDISYRYVIFIQPSTWLISESEEKRAKELKKILNGKVKEVKLFNGNSIFNVKLFVPFSIIYLDKKYNGNFNFIDTNVHEEDFLDKLENINKWNDYKIYPPLRQKILDLSSKKNFLNAGERQDPNGNFYLELAKIRGNVEKSNDSSSMIKNDFYTPFTREIKIKEELSDKQKNIKIHENKRRNWYGFDNLSQAENCKNFLKTRWAMFSLSIYKMSQNIQEKEIRSIPWLDWSEPWTEERFEKLINATPEEIEFVHKNIPDYYRSFSYVFTFS